MPLTQIAIYITTPTPFMKEFFEKVSQLEYPKNRMNVYILNTVRKTTFLLLEKATSFITSGKCFKLINKFK